MTPRGHTIAYQIWAYANPRGWDCTSNEVADALGLDRRAVARVAGLQKWTERFRANAETAQTREMAFSRGVTRNVGSTNAFVTRLDRADINLDREAAE